MDARRKKYIINPKFQFRYTLVFAGLALACLVLSTAAMLHNITDQVDAYITKPSMEISSTGDIILPVVLRVSAAFSVIMLTIIILMLLLYYWHTRKIAKNLDENLGRFAGGDLNFRMDIEHSADFRDMEEAFNLMLSENSSRLSSLQLAAADITQNIETIDSAIADGKDIGQELTVLRTRITEVEGGLACFKLR